jgi:hypothetical protein
MPARYTLLPTAHALVTQQQFKPIWSGMVRGVNAALTNATARGPEFRHWFGGYAARRDIVLAKMTRFVTFLTSPNTVIIQPRIFDPTATDYGHTYQLPHSTTGQWIVYLGPSFNNQPSVWTAANMANPGVQGNQVITIAHEMSHAILGTNKPDRFYDEHYEAAALALAGDDPEYAAWNADNYGFFIEACM